MKKTFPLPSISTTLQLLGVWINGMIGTTLELIAHLIDTLHGKSSTKVFLQKFFIIVISQIIINWIFADNSMLVDMTLWLAEKNYKTLWNGFEMWMAVGNILNLVKIKSVKLESRFLLFSGQEITKERKINRFRILAKINTDCS